MNIFGLSLKLPRKEFLFLLTKTHFICMLNGANFIFIRFALVILEYTSHLGRGVLHKPVGENYLTMGAVHRADGSLSRWLVNSNQIIVSSTTAQQSLSKFLAMIG